MNVFTHHKDTQDQWVNLGKEFKQVPSVGDYVALESAGPYYKVEVVVHCPFHAEFNAEVYMSGPYSTSEMLGNATSFGVRP